jgi:voltage-gated potassium channel
VTGAAGPPRFGSLDHARRRRLVARVVARVFISVAILVVLYYELPMGQEIDTSAALVLTAGIIIFLALVAWHLRRIVAADYPELRAIEALATMIPLFLLVFASSYFLMASSQASAFSQSLTRTDSLYFTITVFSTVGFGDITPLTETARVATMAQMLIDVVVVGVLARVLLGAVHVAHDRKDRTTGDHTSGED